MEKQYLNSKEASSFLGYSQAHLYRLVQNEILPHSKPNGRKIFFKKTDLEAFLNRGYMTCNQRITG